MEQLSNAVSTIRLHDRKGRLAGVTADHLPDFTESHTRFHYHQEKKTEGLTVCVCVCESQGKVGCGSVLGMRLFGLDIWYSSVYDMGMG